MATEVQKQERELFTKNVSSYMGNKQLISVFDFEHIKKLAGYNIRRLAYWVQDQCLKLARECMYAFENLGILGIGKAKISRKLHFA